ncbi:GNAT family N-acetyltransferase [Flavobacterium sp. NRK1]|uniref:GNAT family N-acetyltransferase n=1 Tax=Flavobacterium sp. NRK1 TaxID=2954929 RepID=UPI0020924258|nr:GNAT family N-acetyltransferase [Flavobacterium sp. NRK1]MCO6149130.1 GNAT family N-acetyltransferase [Flavobacterium sp. NRK1]
MEITLRSATENDLAGILTIVNYNILHSTAVYDYNPKSTEYIQQWFTEKKQDNWPVIVADIKGNIAGYGTYGTFRTKDGYKYTVEHSVYVSEEYHGKGIGKILLADLIAIATKNGVHCMIAGIDAENKGSIEFHKKFGFRETGLLKEVGFKFNRWLDVVFMQLILE